MIKVGIIGAAGYTGGELLRILTYHPDVQIVWAVSRSNFGKPVYDVHADLFGDTELKFAEQPTEKADVVFFCTAHGETGKLLAEYNFPEDVKINENLLLTFFNKLSSYLNSHILSSVNVIGYNWHIYLKKR